MVSTSRKKNKGKERKAKKEAIRLESDKVAVRNTWLKWAKGDGKVMGNAITCDHGCGPVSKPNDLDHPVSCFLNYFITYWENKSFTSEVELMLVSFQTHEQVWNNERYREMVVKIMTRMGTNMLLSSEQEVNKVTQSVWALRIANVIVILEHYNGTDSFNKLINNRG